MRRPILAATHQLFKSLILKDGDFLFGRAQATLRTWATGALVGFGIAAHLWLFCGMPTWAALVTAVGLMAVYVWRRKISKS